MNNSWIQETLELIRDWETERESLEFRIGTFQEKIDELMDEQEAIDEKMVAAQALIQAYKEKHNIRVIPPLSSASSSLVNKSYPEILIEIAQKGGGYLKANDVVELMLQSGFSNDRRAIQANIYSALGRMVRDNRFKKMKPGEYRYLNHARKDKNGRPSGIRQAVKELKENKPQWTKREVLNHLLKTGFDFKGKKPANAVNMSWAYLGYSNEGKQHSLLG